MISLKILITGGAGFIGSHLCKALLKNDHDLTIIDNFHPYYSTERKKQQLKEIQQVGQINFYDIDLLNEQASKEIFQKHLFDCVIHLAALPGVAYSINHPLEYVDLDIKATINVLKLCGETGVEQVIFSSSSSVYGNQSGYPLKEEMATGNVLSPYAASKFGAESFCYAYHNLYKFKLTILRFFTVYGPWARPDMGIPTFIQRTLEGKPIELFSKGSARDYTFIEDIVDGIIASIHSKHRCEVFNLGSNRPVRIEQLISLVKEYLPTLTVEERSWRTGDVEQTWADISKAQRLLNFTPKVPIEQGLYQTIQWAKRHFE